MNNQMEMDDFLYVLRNGFQLKNREKNLKLFSQFADENKHLVFHVISQVNPNESEVFWNFLEAIAESGDSWGEFILSEFTRLLCAADIENDPSDIISSLEAFEILLDWPDDEYQKEICKIIKVFMTTKCCVLRKFLMWFYATYTFKLN